MTINTTLKYYLITFLLTLALILGVFKLFNINITQPLNYEGDAIVHYNFAKNIQDTGNWYTNSFYGLPTVQNLYDFPLPEVLPLLLIKSLIFIGFNWIISVNVFYLLTFPITALIALYTLTKLGINTKVALPFSVIYAFMPYHFYRSVNHLFLASYFTVPLAILAAYYIATKGFPNKLTAVVLAVIIASSGAYYTFFSLILICAALLYFFFTHPKVHKKDIIHPLAFICLIFTALALNLLPTLIYTYKFGPNLNATTREPLETEIYGLKITQLLLPVENHNLSIFNKISKKYITYGHQAFINENQYASLGLVAGSGFLFLLVWVLFKPQKMLKEPKIDFLSTLNLTAVLVASVGGFGLLTSVFLNPTFRSQNRISIFIAFIALASLATLLQKHKKATVIAWVLLPLALFDQVSVGVLRNFTKNPSEFSHYQSFAQQIEQTIGDNQKIFTLPFGQYPEGNDKNLMKIALLTKNTYWSTGAQKWRAANYWQYQVSQLPPAQMLEAITAQGFTHLLVYAPEYDALKLAQIEGLLGTNTLTGPAPKNDYLVFNLANIQAKQPPQDILYYISGNCMHDFKDDNLITQYFCKDYTKIVFVNKSDKIQSSLVNADLELSNGNVISVQKEVTLPVGTSSYNIYQNAAGGVFSKPPYWPANLGYPNFKVTKLELNSFCGQACRVSTP